MQEKIDEALKVIDWIYDQLDGLPVKHELHIPCARYYISMQHVNGALALLRLNSPTPAFALARPIYETFMRSIWYSHKASEDERERAQNDDFPTLSKIVKSLEDDPAATNIIKQYENLNVLHSYTHGGSYQILNHIGGTNLKPNFDE